MYCLDNYEQLLRYKEILKNMIMKEGYSYIENVDINPNHQIIGKVDHKDKLVIMNKNINLVGIKLIYDIAHELGHILNRKDGSQNNRNNIFNNEKEAWNKARNICIELGVPLEEFEEEKERCLKSYEYYK